jgi:ABC-type branched-subunit amino acid transport system permease subunit
VTASASAALALGAVALASVGAYTAVMAVYRSDLSALTSPPVANLLALWFALPVVAAVVGWAFAGRPPVRMVRQT